MIFKETFAGSPKQIGLAHGRAYRHVIATNVALLVQHPTPLLEESELPDAERWFRRQRERHFDLWPWLADEVRGIAEGSGVPLPWIERMNFRIWQYDYYGRGHHCSSFAGRARDGTLITGGTLDDPRELYGFCEVRPKRGLRWMSFPIAGTGWANRGMNEAGLVLNASSLPLPGLRFDPARVFQQDICMRVILQTCSTVGEVQALCDRHPFFTHLLVVDSRGGSLALAVSDEGGAVYPARTNCLTNHALEPLRDRWVARGYNGEIPAQTSQSRLNSLADWLAKQDGHLTLRSARHHIGGREGWPDSVNNPMTAFATLAQPQKDARTFWVADKPVTPQGFRPYRF